MRSLAVILLVIFLSAAFMQPMIETANICKDKVALGAAILNSCRAASNLTLEDDKWRDLDAKIDPGEFAKNFAEAFGETFNISQEGSPIVSGDTASLKFSAGGQWDKIAIQLVFQGTANIATNVGLFSHYDLGYNEAIVDISLTTPYVFRTKLLQQVMRVSPTSSYNITEKRRFIVRVIN